MVIKSKKNFLVGLISFLLFLIASFSVIFTGTTYDTAYADGHIHDGIEFTTPWTTSDELPNTAGNYYLTVDVSYSSFWNINTGDTVRLCLNGHKIDVYNLSITNGELHIYDCDNTEHFYYLDNDGWGKIVPNESDANYISANVKDSFLGGYITYPNATNDAMINIDYSGFLGLHGGTLFGFKNNHGHSSAAISMSTDNSATFTMTGGAIIGNTCSEAGAIQVGSVNDGVAYVNISGGVIKHNTAIQQYFDNAAAIHINSGNVVVNITGGVIDDNFIASQSKGAESIYSRSSANATINISGNPIIEHLRLRNQCVFHITGDLDASARIGVSSDNPGKGKYITDGINDYIWDEANIFSYSPSYLVYQEAADTELELLKQIVIQYYNKDGTTLNGDLEQIKTEGIDIALQSKPATGYDRTGYDFIGWATSAGGNKAYNFGDTYTSDYWLLEQFYPAYRPQNYNITYVLNGGTNNSNNPLRHTYGTDTIIQNPTRAGYIFDGWTVDGGVDKYVNLTLGATDYTGGITLTAYWTLVEFTKQPIETDMSVEVTLGASVKTYRWYSWENGVAYISANHNESIYNYEDYEQDLQNIVLYCVVTLNDDTVLESNKVNIHRQDGITYNAWNSNNSLPNTTGYFYLTSNVTLTAGAWNVPECTIDVCLNGYSIIQNTEDSSVIVVPYGSTLNIRDCNHGGEYTHYYYIDRNGTNNDENDDELVYVNSYEDVNYQSASSNYRGNSLGGCISGGTRGGIVVSGGTLNLYGGTIVHNSNTGFGGGVVVEGLENKPSIFNMYGGFIVGNKSSALGGGLYIGENSDVIIQGDFTWGGYIEHNIFVGWTESEDWPSRIGDCVYYHGGSTASLRLMSNLFIGSIHIDNNSIIQDYDSINNPLSSSSIIAVSVNPIGSDFTDGSYDIDNYVAECNGYYLIYANPTTNVLSLRRYWNVAYKKPDDSYNYSLTQAKISDVELTLATASTDDYIRSGYNLDGWATSQNGEKVYNFGESYTINSGITLYPHYTIIIYNITYTNAVNGANGVTNNNPTTYTIEDENIVLTAPTRTGYNLTSWTGSGVTIEHGSTGDKTYEASWEIIHYTITYNNAVNGEAGVTNSNPTTYTIEDENIVLTAPTRIGYNLANWTGASITIEHGSTGDKEYVATWEVINYDINYIMNNGTNHINNPSSYNIESETIELSNPSREYYDFVAWKIDNTVVTTISTGSYGELEITAIWTPIVYNISYSMNGGTNNANNPMNYTIETTSFNLAAPSRDYYDFAGWTGDNTTFTQGSTNGNKSFVATWTPIVYTITYTNAINGESGVANENPTIYTVETDTITLDNPTKTGYDFTGWTQQNVTIPQGSNGNLTFDANWCLSAPTVETYVGYTGTYDGVAHNIGITLSHILDVTFTYQWKKNGVDILGATAATYVVKDVVDSATYSVEYKAILDTEESGTTTQASIVVSIGQKSLIVTANPKTIVYGNVPTNDNVLFNGFVNEETNAVLSGTLAFGYDYEQYGHISDVNHVYHITPLGYTSENYSITYETGVLTVEPKALTVTISSKSSAYGEEHTALSATITEGTLENGDSVPYTLSCAVTATSNVGLYNITGTSTNSNYAVTFVNEVNAYEVTKRVITATAENKTIHEGDSIPAYTYLLSENNVESVRAELSEKTTLTSIVDASLPQKYVITFAFKDGFTSDNVLQNYKVMLVNAEISVLPKVLRDNDVEVILDNEEDAFDFDISIKVEEEQDIDYDAISAKYVDRRSEISTVYSVKLLRTVIANGVETTTEIQPADIKEGTIVIVKIEIPEHLIGRNFRVLHIHSTNDIEYVDKSNIEIREGFVYVKVNKLSEFAFVSLKASEEMGHMSFCLGWLLFIFVCIMLAYLIVHLILKRKEKLCLIGLIASAIVLAFGVAVICLHTCVITIVAFVLSALIFAAFLTLFLLLKKKKKTMTIVE